MKKRLLLVGIIIGLVIASIFFLYISGTSQPAITSEPHHFVVHANDSISVLEKP